MLQDERRVRKFLLDEIDKKARSEGRSVKFIQVGANDGITDDPLSEYILRGNWQGVLIEPVRSAFAALKANYAGIDGLTFLNVAVANSPGEAEIFTCSNSRISSLSKAFVEKKSGGSPIESYRVPLTSLTEIIERHVPIGIDIIVVDAEGYDAVILSTVDFSRYKPKLIVFESHNISQLDQDNLKENIEPHGYIFINMYADTAVFAKGEIQFDTSAAKMLEKIIEEDVSKSKRLRDLNKDSKATPTKYGASMSIKTSTDSVREPRKKIEDSRDRNVKKWYFSSNHRGLENNFEDIQVAVISAIKNTSLTPICMYNGPNCWQLEWLESHNVKIIRGDSSLKKDLQKGYGKNYDTFSAHWLRIDIPDIEADDTLCLYTDIDVIFLDDPASYVFGPRYIAAAEEMKKGARDHFNSGVMVLNNRNLRLLMPWFKSAIKNRLEIEFSYPPHDQGSFNQFFKNNISWLDPRFNWKPYWGINNSAAIVHFHGPKPKNVRALQKNINAPMKGSFKKIYKNNIDGYHHYIKIYDEILTSAKKNIEVY